jgi:O-antigen/teichoic acid export membrane protein
VAELDRGTAWIGAASAVSGGLDVVSTLACIGLWVSPADFGEATLASAMFPVIERLAGLGLGAAAVRGGDRRELSSMFWVALASSLVVLGLAINLGPIIGDAFARPLLGGLLCGYAVKLVIQNAHVIPEALLRRDLQFRTLALVRIAATVADTIAKLGAAYLGAHGHPALRVWCFVIGPIANVAVTAIGILWSRPWWPAFTFELRAAAAALRFGLQVSVAEILYYAYTSADYLVVGRAFGDAAVGTYRLAYELVLDVVRLVSMVTGAVAFPAFARLAGDRGAAAALLVRFTRQNLIALAPFLVLIAVSADDLLAVLYPPLGPAAATAARILCLVGLLRTLSFVLPPMLVGLGQARDVLIYNAVATVVLPAAFAIAAWRWPEAGYVAVAWAWAAAYPVAFGVLLWLALARTQIAARVYVRGIAGILACAAGASLCALGARLVLPDLAIVQVLGVAAVTLGSYGALLAWIEGVSPRGVVRAMRGDGP